MSNVIRKVQRQGRDAGMIPGRTFEKTQGCWNCIHYVTGKKAIDFFNGTCKPRDKAAMESYIAVGQHQAADEMKQLLKLAGKAIKTGGLGMCGIGKPKTDFVAHNFLCEDGWTGAQGASMAREGAKPDLTPGELKDIVDGSGDAESAVEEAVAESGLILKP